MLLQTAINHCKQWRRACVKLLRKGKNLHFFFVYRWGAAWAKRRRRKCRGVCWATSDRQELVLFFNSGLPTLAGRPLSARALSTPRLPSIPGLFLCGRQHPASACLTSAWTSPYFNRARSVEQAEQPWHVLLTDKGNPPILKSQVQHITLRYRLQLKLACHLDHVCGQAELLLLLFLFLIFYSLLANYLVRLTNYLF